MAVVSALTHERHEKAAAVVVRKLLLRLGHEKRGAVDERAFW